MGARVEYRTVPNVPHRQVGSDGTVWSNSRHGRQTSAVIRGEWRLLKQGADKDGYATVSMRRRVYRVHELVLLVFVGPRPTSAHQGCHKDGNRLNNYLTNLYWGTRIQNAADKRRHGTHPAGERNGRHKLTQQQVDYIMQFRGGATGVASTLALQFGVTRSIIHKVWRGQLWSEA